MKSIGRIQQTVGIGLRLPHIAEVVATRPPPGWLEIHPEKFLANPHTNWSRFSQGGKNQPSAWRFTGDNYETSLVKALLGKFPGTAWLVGSSYLSDALGYFAWFEYIVGLDDGKQGRNLRPGAQRTGRLGLFGGTVL